MRNTVKIIDIKNCKYYFFNNINIIEVKESFQKNQRKAFKKNIKRYQNLSEEEKDKKRQHAREWYRNHSEK